MKDFDHYSTDGEGRLTKTQRPIGAFVRETAISNNSDFGRGGGRGCRQLRGHIACEQIVLLFGHMGGVGG